MGRRRRRQIIRKPKPKIPEFFICPVCGRQGVMVTMDKKKQKAYVKCAYCDLEEEVSIKPRYEPVDAYAKVVDKVSGQ